MSVMILAHQPRGGQGMLAARQALAKATDEGRGLYAQLGWTFTSEMALILSDRTEAG